MNGAEQHQRRTAVVALQQQIDDQATVVDGLDTRITEIARAALLTLDEFRDQINRLIHDDLAHDQVIVRLRPLAETTFLQRLSWLLTGRT